GKLYEIDARLRPSGQASPLASEVEGFAEYQKNSAWSWEHMALTRARVIAGAPDLAAHVAEIIRDVLAKQRDGAELVCDVADMRERIDKERLTKNLWKLKHVRGGLLDLDGHGVRLPVRSLEGRWTIMHLEVATESAVRSL
ncbi:MAG: glutamine-synthetase adenylyltransferase, partial [Gemmatimonadetes bacterium]|nr:glutamine-synthetase adenylyltransferase [Gemmatimonadota bacterium]